MKWFLIIVAALMLSIWGMNHSLAEDSHKHSHDDKKKHSEEESHKHEDDEDHKDEAQHTGHSNEEEGHEHKEGEEHSDEGEKHAHGEGEEEEESSSVGPDKGILAKSDKGIQLAPEAVSSYELKTVEVSGSILKLSKDSIVKIKDEKTVYRVRDGWYKRVQFKNVSSDSDLVVIESSHLKSGDKVVTVGVGFLRMAEVAAEGGASHGHSH